LGGTGDGPKWVCDPHRLTAQKDCLVYSVGSNNNFEFEKSVYNDIGPHCEIHTFDPSVSFVKATNRPDYVNYHHWGFSASDLNVEDPGLESKQGVGQNANQNTWVMRSLATAVKHLGHEGRSIHLFKIDCEGCEFHRNSARESFWDTMAGVDIDIRQILVELHYRTDTKVANPQTGAISPYPAAWWFFVAVVAVVFCSSASTADGRRSCRCRGGCSFWHFSVTPSGTFAWGTFLHGPRSMVLACATAKVRRPCGCGR